VIVASLVFGRRLARVAKKGEAIGLMVPNSIGAAVAFLALQATGRVPAMLNHTAGVDAVLSACRTAQLRTVVTSRRFIELAKLDALAAQLGGAVEIIWLEDLRARLGVVDKLYGLFALRLRDGAAASASSPRTRGDPLPRVRRAPKGVVLSTPSPANRRQLRRVDFSRLTRCSTRCRCSTAWPHCRVPTAALAGVRVSLYPSPLHYRSSPSSPTTWRNLVIRHRHLLAGYGRAPTAGFLCPAPCVRRAEAVRDETRWCGPSASGSASSKAMA
jgi:acyl-[acyl-carrier-protein]-phospholipid O-acyltransferase/long-chain-fatty-acid--[acyl-carrier-protein] ligase